MERNCDAHRRGAFVAGAAWERETSRPDGDLRERVAEAVQSVTLSTAEGCDCDLPPARLDDDAAFAVADAVLAALPAALPANIRERKGPRPEFTVERPMTPALSREERAAMRADHSDTYPDPGHSTAVCCAMCDEWPPCKTIRLLDALDAAEAEARTEFDIATGYMAEHDAQVLREAADELSAAIGTEPVLMHIVDWTEGVEYAERTIRARADAMTRQADAPGEAEPVCTPGTRCTPWPHPHAHTAPAADDEGGQE